MQLFEILQDGFHTPLTETQVAELFRAGRLERKTPCKPVKQATWRTIDELFPLLKYHAPWRLGYQSPEPGSEFRFRRGIVIGAGLVVAAAAALAASLYLERQDSDDRRITTVDNTVSSQPLPPVVSQSSAPTFANSSSSQVWAVPAERPDAQSATRLAEAQRIAEQTRRNQAVADQQRAHQQALLAQQKAAGQDSVIPLDQRVIVNVGGIGVGVMVHDNDTTSFDVWINGLRHHEVPKQKGITQSGTDETFIYGNGRANLYYVWEISGKVNHCRLRVREH